MHASRNRFPFWEACISIRGSMNVREIVRYPDLRLRTVAEPIERFDGDLVALAEDILDTMRAAPGIGITAPHIGVLKRLVVLELPESSPKFYVNPEIVWASEEKIITRKAVSRCQALSMRSSATPASKSAIRTSTGTSKPRNRKVCSPSVISTK